MANRSNLTGLGIALGAALGAVAGVMAGHIAIWLGVGIAIGMVLGASVRGGRRDCPECAEIHQTHEMKRRNENERLAAGN
ncbi:MAG TPA: hypothetical protein VKR60_01590 [Candidatus Sulfotelmatobacter sp.]|nr:hypothetical protein [Candidatus Sulfotelmatobacter sp.]